MNINEVHWNFSDNGTKEPAKSRFWNFYNFWTAWNFLMRFSLLCSGEWDLSFYLCVFIYTGVSLRYWAKMHLGHESSAITMLFLNEIMPLAIPYHSSPIPMSMQCICKILLKFVYSFLRYWPKIHFGHKSRAITLLFLNEIIPLAIPSTPLRYQCLCKVWRK